MVLELKVRLLHHTRYAHICTYVFYMYIYIYTHTHIYILYIYIYIYKFSTVA
jgi:hypothetical protein